MFRKEVILDVGNYHSLPKCEDYALWFRVLYAGFEGYNITHPILYYRGGHAMLKRRDKSYNQQ